MEVIELSFTNAQPTMLLMPVQPDAAPAEFVNVLVGEKGAPGKDGTFPGASDDIGGFTTDPIFYYILASN